MIPPNAGVGVVTRTSWFSSLYQVTRATWAQGGLAGFYVGLTPGLIGPTVAWGSYMLAYTWSKQNNVIAHTLNVDARSPGATFIAGVQAGVFMTLVTNPIFVVKTRMQTSYLHQTSPSSTATTSLRLRHVVADLIRNEGIRGMYKGLVPALPLTTHGALHWAIFESMKSVVLQHSIAHPPRSSPSSVPTTSETTHIVALSSRQLTYTQTLIVAALSKVVAAAATYPLHVIKTCIQAHRGEAPITVRQVSANIYALNGLRGFYAGFLPHLLRTVPSSTVTMFFIEQLTQAMMAAFPNTVSSPTSPRRSG
jgi:solute carrier family 25 folate transporter 32